MGIFSFRRLVRSFALVLGLPNTNLREFLLPVAFGIVLISLLLQGLTMPVLIRKSDVGPVEDDPKTKS